MPIRQVLADNLRRLRQERGLSQEALADAAGINLTYVSALERCRYAATIDVLERLAVALLCLPSDLISPTSASVP